MSINTMNRTILTLLLPLIIAGCNNKGQHDVETVKVKHGTFILDITEEGEIGATRAINISSPAMSWRYGMLKIEMIVDEGTQVQEGDTVIVFDPTDVLKVRMDNLANLEIAHAELEKLRAQQQAKINELESNLKITEISHEISEIYFEQSAYEADITRKEIKLDLEKAKITLDKARSEIENQKKIHKEEEQQSLLRIKQLEADVEEANQTLEDLTVTTPSPGIAIKNRNYSTGNKWQEGDQTWSGNILINLPDLSELKVKADVNEVDISKVKVGQPAAIKLDAFSDTTFKGKVINVANLANFKQGSKKIKVFPIEILIEGSSERLMPGMTVSCKIEIDKIESQTYIPLEALFKSGVEEYVYVKAATGFKKKVIVTGLSNNDHIIVEEGLEAGDDIAISDPFIEENETKNEK